MVTGKDIKQSLNLFSFAPFESRHLQSRRAFIDRVCSLSHGATGTSIDRLIDLLASVFYIVNWKQCLTSVNCRLQLARVATRIAIYKRSFDFDTTGIAISDDVALRSPSTIRDPIL